MRKANCFLAVAGAIGHLVLPFATAKATPVDVLGAYTGSVGGESINATLTGFLGDDGQGSAKVTFSSLPNQLDSQAALGIIITIYCPIRPKACIAGQTIFDLSGGSYDLTRKWTFDGYPGDDLNVSATATLAGSDLTISGSLNGVFPGDGGDAVASYIQLLTPNGPGSILESGQAKLGSGLVARWIGEYQYTGDALSREFSTELEWDSLNLSGSQFQAEWTATCTVPEPSCGLLLGFGLVVVFGFGRKITEQ